VRVDVEAKSGEAKQLAEELLKCIARDQEREARKPGFYWIERTLSRPIVAEWDNWGNWHSRFWDEPFHTTDDMVIHETRLVEPPMSDETPIAETYEEGGIWLPVGHEKREIYSYLYEDGSTWRPVQGRHPASAGREYTPAYWRAVIARNATGKGFSPEELEELLAA
jgi:hypothetical protein